MGINPYKVYTYEKYWQEWKKSNLAYKHQFTTPAELEAIFLSSINNPIRACFICNERKKVEFIYEYRYICSDACLNIEILNNPPDNKLGNFIEKSEELEIAT